MEKCLIDWLDETTVVRLNPHLPQEIYETLEKSVLPYQAIKGHLWISSSGTESFPKMIALSKEAFLASAKGVNEHFAIDAKDKWLNVLPLFHVGGLATHARAFLSKSTILDHSEHKWDPDQFVKLVEENQITFTSLTPTHVYDLVKGGHQAPLSLRVVVVGGGVLSEALHEVACELGWPLHRSYGMTEVCSQIATSRSPKPGQSLELLSHVAARINENQFIEIKSEALLTGYIEPNHPEKRWIDPKRDGWYTTQDKGELKGSELIIHGRGAGFLKIGGENVNFAELENLWDKIKVQCPVGCDTALIDILDERLGRVVCLVCDKECDLAEPIKRFQSQVLPIAKIRRVYHVEKIPRTALHKLKKEDLRSMILSAIFH